MTCIEARGDGGHPLSSSRVNDTNTDSRHHGDCERHGLSRRRLLAAIGGGVTVGAAGCLSTDAPDPVTLGDEDACDVCGMVIPQHPGPSAELFYRDEEPSGHPNPARFDSTWEAFQYDFERDDRGWTRVAFYVTDYSSVEYEVFTEDDTTFISTHPAADAFTDATEVSFVVGSAVEGAMGQDLIAFSDDDDSRAFAEEYGGTVTGYDDVTRSMVAELSQA